MVNLHGCIQTCMRVVISRATTRAVEAYCTYVRQQQVGGGIETDELGRPPMTQATTSSILRDDERPSHRTISHPHERHLDHDEALYTFVSHASSC